MIYGIFILFGALAGTFFVFNTGQLSAEKTKLVNTADTVAYSAGVMHARALNFSAYTNRALLANETTVAQMVSIASWLQYSQRHQQRINPMLCRNQFAIPILTGTIEYVPLCFALTWGGAALVLQSVQQAFNNFGGAAAVAASEVSKQVLQAAQLAMFADMVFARNGVMRDVANANYRNDFSVSVDTIPLTDNWIAFEGGPFIARRTGNERARFRDLEVSIVNRDNFVRDRSWVSQSPWPCQLVPAGRAQHTGSTVLNGYTSWSARDDATFSIRGPRSLFRCRTTMSYSLGTGTRTASTNTAGLWRYSGVPNFYDLSNAALDYGPGNRDANRRDTPRLKFAIRLTRDRGEQKTSEGRSGIRPAGRLAVYTSDQVASKMATLSTSEVFFDRSHTPRADGRQELASLFNPFWQVHLIPTSEAVKLTAIAMQGAGN